jgi:hypothetical protein
MQTASTIPIISRTMDQFWWRLGTTPNLSIFEQLEPMDITCHMVES